MASSDYEYRGLIASAWDLLRGDTSSWPDRAFYKELIFQSGQPVLDVGCGTGRLLLDFLADGIDIDGVDNSPEMLALCREKGQKLGLHPVLFQQSMETLDVPRRYRTIIVPSSSFQLVTDISNAAEAMRRFYSHLEPGSTLVMPFMLLWEGPITDSTVTGEWEFVAEQVRPDDDLLIRRWTRSTFHLLQQLEDTEDRYEVVREGKVIASELYSRTPATRWYTQEQVRHLYERAGFTNIRLMYEFSWKPAKPEDSVFCVLGVRP